MSGITKGIRISDFIHAHQNCSAVIPCNHGFPCLFLLPKYDASNLNFQTYFPLQSGYNNINLKDSLDFKNRKDDTYEFS